MSRIGTQSSLTQAPERSTDLLLNMVETSAIKAPNNGKGRPLGSKDKIPRASRIALSEVRKLQQIVFSKVTQEQDRDDLAQLIGAWDKLEERKRILKGAPLPGSLKPESPKAKKAQPLTYTPEGLDK